MVRPCPKTHKQTNKPREKKKEDTNKMQEVAEIQEEGHENYHIVRDSGILGNVIDIKPKHN